MARVAGSTSTTRTFAAPIPAILAAFSSEECVWELTYRVWRRVMPSRPAAPPSPRNLAGRPSSSAKQSRTRISSSVQ